MISANKSEGKPALWFGQHKGRPIDQIPTGYLLWAYRTVRLSGRLRAAIRRELEGRGGGARLPPEPEKPLPVCDRCDDEWTELSWHELGDGRRQIRATCRFCYKFVGFVPQTPRNVALANENKPKAGLLDALTTAEAE